MANTFNEAEDLLIGTLWMKFSEDPTVRDTGGLWKKILDDFIQKMRKPLMTVNSITDRWSFLQGEIANFCSVYEDILAGVPSSTTTAEVVNMSAEQYPHMWGNSFEYIQLWERLCKHPIWIQHLETLKAISSQGSSSSTSSFRF